MTKDNQNKINKDSNEELNKPDDNSSDDKKPNRNIKPPRFYNLSEGVNPKIHSDEAVKEKEKKYNG